MALDGTTVCDGVNGTVHVAVTGTNLVAADGTLTPAGAGVDAEIALTQIPIPRAARSDRLETLTVTAKTADLGVSLDVAVAAEASLKERRRAR